MRSALVLVLLLWSGSSPGSELPGVVSPSRPAKPAPIGVYEGGGRTGGDTIADAVVIPSLPFTDSGNTCGFANDYDEVCPYNNSTGPDVVYSYFEPSGSQVSVDLCGSSYDTKVYVYEDVEGNLVGCNDDQCGPEWLQSRIYNLGLGAGHTYYFVVDGYGAECGAYTLSIAPVPPCVVECPPGAQHEGEPPCQDHSPYDTYNGGCGGLGWTYMEPTSGDCGVMCGRSCTYLYQGMSYRDTDWYWAKATGGPVTLACRAEFPVLLILLFQDDLLCNDLQYVHDEGGPCEEVTLSHTYAPGQEFWIWVGPSVFTGVPESDYTLEACGLAPMSYGACCWSFYCETMPGSYCTQNGGVFLGDGTDCDPNPCGGNLPGACCYLSGACRYETILECGGHWMGAGVPCDPNPCGPAGVTEQPELRVSTWGSIKNRYRETVR